MIATSDILATIATSRWTGLVVSPSGEVVEVVPFSCALTSDSFLEFARAHARGRRFRIVQQSELSEGELARMLSEVAAPARGAIPRTAALYAKVEAFEPGLHPNAPARAIADAIGKWFIE